MITPPQQEALFHFFLQLFGDQSALLLAFKFPTKKRAESEFSGSERSFSAQLFFFLLICIHSCRVLPLSLIDDGGTTTPAGFGARPNSCGCCCWHSGVARNYTFIFPSLPRWWLWWMNASTFQIGNFHCARALLSCADDHHLLLASHQPRPLPSVSGGRHNAGSLAGCIH